MENITEQARAQLKQAGEQQKKAGRQESACVRLADDKYPPLLRELAVPPRALHYRGDWSVLQGPCIAIVGSRKTSPYGRWAAYELGKKAAQNNITVVSGMALGIDSAAHQGALDAGGKTAAVLGCGVDRCYPPSNRNLYEAIAQKGVLLSEYSDGTAPHAGQFPVRNRIISGLSAVTVVVEAALSSGSLITAGHAAEQGREVLAVPGNLNQVFSYGCNKLIRDGASILTSFDDILDVFHLEHAAAPENTLPRLSGDEEQLYRVLRNEGELSMNTLALRLAKNVGDVAALVTCMELKGLVVTDMGKVFLAKP